VRKAQCRKAKVKPEGALSKREAERSLGRLRVEPKKAPGKK
jgi:hypothetical protein